MSTVSIVGAGTMGAGLSRLFAAAGHVVRVFDARPGVAAAVAEGRERVEAAADLRAAAARADLCIEAVVEDLAVKRGVLAELAGATGRDTILATNTSALSVDAIAEAVDAEERGRVVGAHFFNPPETVPAVEVVRGAATSPAVIDRLVALLRDAGKTAAVVADTPGFVANRIQHAMIVEAWRCLEDGVATAADIDTIVSASFGFRLFAYGPFETGDLNGLDVYASVMRTLEAAYGERFRPPRSLLERVDRGALGVKSGEGVFSYRDGRGEQVLRRRDELLSRLAALRNEEL